MLDAYIIQRIRQQRDESRSSERVPLRIEIPVDRPDDRHPAPRKEDEERGIVVIDFTI